MQRPAHKGVKLRTTWRAVLPVFALVIACITAAYGYQRYARGNFGTVVPFAVYRSAQPSPGDLAKWSRKFGIKSVLNLRDDVFSKESDAEMREAQSLALRYIHLPLSAGSPPAAARLSQLINVLQNSPRPMLIHCRAGADRTGVVSVLAAMSIGGEPYQAARKQLAVWHLRLLPGSWGIGAILAAFENHAEQKGLKSPAWADFAEWARLDYAALHK